MKTYWVYLMASASRTLYTGVTNNLERRVFQHRYKALPGFTAQYNIKRLVYFEDFHDIRAAIAREKPIKGWVRVKKVALFDSMNRDWRDLSEGRYGKSKGVGAMARHPWRKEPAQEFLRVPFDIVLFQSKILHHSLGSARGSE